MHRTPQFLDCAGQIITIVCCETRILCLLPNITLSDCKPYTEIQEWFK